MRRIRPTRRHSDLPGVLAVSLRDTTDRGNIYGSCIYSGRWQMGTDPGSYTTTRNVNYVVVFDDGRIGLAYDSEIRLALAELGLRLVDSPPGIAPEPVPEPELNRYSIFEDWTVATSDTTSNRIRTTVLYDLT